MGALYNLAQLREEQGRTAKAQRYYRQAIDQGHGGAPHSLAVLYQEQEQTAKAERYYRKAGDRGVI